MFLFPANTANSVAGTFPGFSIFRRFGILVTFSVYLARGMITFITINYGTPQLTPVITIEDGALQGRLAYSRERREYWQFLAIPYAEPPVGSLRFQPPMPVQPWGKDNVKQVTRFPPACVQFDPIFVVRAIGREDCLFLNVFTSKDTVHRTAVGKRGAPVLVYIHGGAFMEGESSLYHPTFLMDHGPLVIVVLQYRLGPLGFLNFQDTDPKYPRGNMGLKDQNMVLKWVQKNIMAFGGNPERVTIMGDSAGAASVNFHMVSPMSRNLFQRAVSISGSSLCPWAFTQRSREIALKYGSRFGCVFDITRENSSAADELLDCFKSMKASDLVKMQWSWADPSLEKDEFVPSIEPSLTNDTFLSEPPNKIIQEGRTSPVPYLMGVTSGDGGLRSARFEAIPELMEKLAKDWDTVVGRLMFFDKDPLPPEITRKIRDFYFKQGIPRVRTGFRSNKRDLLKPLTDLSGDALFYEPVHTAALEHAKRDRPTYLFYYDYRSKFIPGSYSFFRATRPTDGMWSTINFMSGLGMDWFREKLLGGEAKQREIYGVGHGENALQIWDAMGITGPIVEGDRKFSEEFVKTITDFVKGRELAFRGVRWPRINSTDMSIVPYMLMDTEGRGKVVPEPMSHRMKFWEDLAKFREERS